LSITLVRQYITLGNISENPKAHLFLIDYSRRRRFKISGELRAVEGDQALTAQAAGYKARAERVTCDGKTDRV